MIKPPAFRFLRVFDIQEYRMRNIWMRLETQEQIDAVPRACEICGTSDHIEGVIKELERVKHMFTSEEFEKIKELAADKSLLNLAKDPTYEVMHG